jgi:hypothetical protein
MAKTNELVHKQREELIRCIKGITGLELKRANPKTTTAGLSVSNKDMRANMFAHLLCNGNNFQIVAWMLENWKDFQSGEFIPEEYVGIADPVSVGYACGTSPRFVLAFNSAKKSKVDRHQSKDAAKTGRPQEFIAWAQSWRMAMTQSLWVGTSRSVKNGMAPTKIKVSNEEPWAAYDDMLVQMLEVKPTNEDWLVYFQPKVPRVVAPQMGYVENNPIRDEWCAEYCDTIAELLQRPIVEEIPVDTSVQTAIESQKRLASLLAEGGLTVAKTLSSTKDFAAAANAALERLRAKKAADAAKAAEAKPETIKPEVKVSKPKTGKAARAA